MSSIRFFKKVAPYLVDFAALIIAIFTFIIYFSWLQTQNRIEEWSDSWEKLGLIFAAAVGVAISVFSRIFATLSTFPCFAWVGQCIWGKIQDIFSRCFTCESGESKETVVQPKQTDYACGDRDISAINLSKEEPTVEKTISFGNQSTLVDAKMIQDGKQLIAATSDIPTYPPPSYWQRIRQCSFRAHLELGSIHIIDTAIDEIVDTFRLKRQPARIDVTLDGEQIGILCQDDKQPDRNSPVISILYPGDSSSLLGIIKMVDIEVGGNPQQIMMVPVVGGIRVLVADFELGIVSVVDSGERQIVGTIRLGIGLIEMIPIPDIDLILLASLTEKSVAVIEAISRVVNQRFSLRQVEGQLKSIMVAENREMCVVHKKDSGPHDSISMFKRPLTANSPTGEIEVAKENIVEVDLGENSQRVSGDRRGYQVNIPHTDSRNLSVIRNQDLVQQDQPNEATSEKKPGEEGEQKKGKEKKEEKEKEKKEEGIPLIPRGSPQQAVKVNHWQQYSPTPIKGSNGLVKYTVPLDDDPTEAVMAKDRSVVCIALLNLLKIVALYQTGERKYVNVKHVVKRSFIAKVRKLGRSTKRFRIAYRVGIALMLILFILGIILMYVFKSVPAEEDFYLMDPSHNAMIKIPMSQFDALSSQFGHKKPNEKMDAIDVNHPPGRVTVISLRQLPLAWALTPDEKEVYTVMGGSDSVMVISTLSDTVTTTIFVGGVPMTVAISPDGKWVYVLSESINITVIATSNHTVVTTLLVPGGESLKKVLFAPDGKVAFVLSDYHVFMINTTNQKVIQRIKMDQLCEDMALTADGMWVYITSRVANLIAIIDVKKQEVFRRPITEGVGKEPRRIEIGARKWGFVANYGSETLSVIDTDRKIICSNITVKIQPYPLMISPDGTRVYVGNEVDQDVSAIQIAEQHHDCTENKRIGTISISLSAIPIEMAITSDGSRMVVTHQDGYPGGGGGITVIDTVQFSYSPDQKIQTKEIWIEGSRIMGVLRVKRS